MTHKMLWRLGSQLQFGIQNVLSFLWSGREQSTPPLLPFLQSCHGAFIPRAVPNQTGSWVVTFSLGPKLPLTLSASMRNCPTANHVHRVPSLGCRQPIIC